jgi:hypothetical protein
MQASTFDMHAFQWSGQLPCRQLLRKLDSWDCADEGTAIAIARMHASNIDTGGLIMAEVRVPSLVLRRAQSLTVALRRQNKLGF